MPENFPKYQFVEHTADIAIRAFGRTKAEVFINSALGMMDFLFGEEIFNQKPDQKEIITIESPDPESLLVDFLSELLTKTLTNYCAFIQFKILELSENKLKVEVKSVKAKAKDDIKAVTYYDLSIKQDKNGLFEALVTYDI